MGSDTVKIFCPKCQCVYHPPPIRPRSHSIDDIGSANVDGSAFGTTFAHLFLMTFHTLVPEGLTQESAYIPRIFGFRLHKTAKSRNDVGAASNSISIVTASTRSNRRSHTSSVATAAMAVSTGVNGLNTADQDAADAAADDSTRAPLGHVGQEDNTAASSAIVANDNCNEIKSTKGSGLLINKKGAKGKNAEDSGASSKRKGKSSSNGDGEGIVKRQKRPNSKT